MEEYTGIFDILSSAIEEKNSNIAGDLTVDDEMYGEIESFCDEIDNLVIEYGGEDVYARVDDDLSIIIRFKSPYIILKKSISLQNVMISKASSISVSGINGGMLLLEFTFPSIWYKE